MLWVRLATVWLALAADTLQDAASDLQEVSAENDETDDQSSRKILGSSVVTSVSVVMETNNGKHTYYADALGHPLTKPHIASQVASPINLLNPDRYEFYTFNDNGELVKRLMTLEEIQGIIAGGDGESSNYNSDYNPQMLTPNNDVSNVVENVQNVLKEEMEAHKYPSDHRPILDTPDVSATWNMILPAFLGDAMMNDAMTLTETDHGIDNQLGIDESSTEHVKLSSRTPDGSEDNAVSLADLYEVVEDVNDTTTSSSEDDATTEARTESVTNDFYTTAKIKDPVSIQNETEDVFIFNEDKIDSSTEIFVETKKPSVVSVTPSSTIKTVLDTNDSITSMPLIERVNIPITEATTASKLTATEFPKITELVSMVTRLTTKPVDKTTTTTIPTTFSQFTNTEAVSQSGTQQTSEKQNVSTNVATESEPDSTTMINLEQNFSDVMITDATTIDGLTETTEYDKIESDINELIANLSQDLITNDQDISVENYNISLIEQMLNAPGNLSDVVDKTATFSSSIVVDNNVAETTENIVATTMQPDENTASTQFEDEISKESIDTLLPLFSTVSMQKNTTTTPLLPSTTVSTVPSSTTTESTSTTSTTTTTEIPKTTQQLSTSTTTAKPSTTTASTTTSTTTTAASTTTSTTTIPTTIKTTTTQKLTTEKIIEKTENMLLEIVSTKNKITTTEPSTTASTSTQTTKNISRTTTTVAPIIVNRFQDPSTTTTQLNEITTSTSTSTTSKPSTAASTQYIKLTEAPKIVYNKTTLKTTTEKITTPLIITSTIKNILNQNENKTTLSIAQSTTSKPRVPVTSTTIITSTSTVEPITKKPPSTVKFVSSSTTTKKPILSTSTTASTTTNLHVVTTTSALPNISEPYRRTEELNQQNKLSATNSWSLVQTVKPPENKIASTTHKPIEKPTLEPYHPTIKVDLSSQGNFGMPELSEDMHMFSKLYNELALKFWNALSIKDISSDRSVTVSPFGAISVLAMVFLGARGGTSEKMNDVLKLDDIVTFNPHLVFKEVTESVTARKAVSAIVRELYSDISKGKVLDFYKERVRQFYDGHVEEVDFKKINNVIRRRTNALVNKQTRGKIPQYLEETTLTLREPLSALSTNLFQADCSQASTEGRDGELYFIVLPSIRQRRLVPIPAAVWRAGFIAGYDPELDATAVSLGTMHQAVSTVFVMPGQQGHSAPGDVLLRLESRLLNTTYIPETWTQLLKSMLPRPGLEIQLPRFLHKSVINTTESLKRMGLKEMFDRTKADLRGLNGNAHDLYFADMLQINEFSICGDAPQHTETYPSMIEHLENHNEQMRNFKYIDYAEESEYDRYLSIPLPLRPRQARLPDVPRLRFDRPFLYFVRHNPTGLILHMGRFNPRLIT